MKRKLVWRRKALRQVHEAFRYGAERNLNAAVRWLNRLTSLIDTLAEIPRMGHRIQNETFEEMRSITVEPYVVFCAVESGSILIVEVTHFRRNTDPQQIRDAPLDLMLPAAPSLLP